MTVLALFSPQRDVVEEHDRTIGATLSQELLAQIGRHLDLRRQLYPLPRLICVAAADRRLADFAQTLTAFPTGFPCSILRG